MFLLKGTVNVFSSDKYDKTRFTTVPYKALSDQVCMSNKYRSKPHIHQT